MKPDKSVLIIDDDLGIRDGLTVLLQKFFLVESAASGKEAVDIISKRLHDIYIIDLFLGDMNGFEILSFIKENYPSAITIILTGYGNDDDILKAKRLGANEFLHKPISFKQLKEVIDKLSNEKYDFKSTEKSLEISHNLLKGINSELFENLKPAIKSMESLRGILPEKYFDDIDFSIEQMNIVKIKLDFIKYLIEFKNNGFIDSKEDVSIKSVFEKSLTKYPLSNVYKRIMIDDKRAYVYFKSFQLLVDVMISMLQSSEKSVLKIVKNMNNIEFELINANLVVQDTLDSDNISEGFPYIEFSLLKEILRYTGSRFNIKKDGLYTNLIVTVKVI